MAKRDYESGEIIEEFALRRESTKTTSGGFDNGSGGGNNNTDWGEWGR